MVSEVAVDTVGWVASGLTVVMFLSNLVPLWTIWRRRSWSGLRPVGVHGILLNTTMWFSYGFAIVEANMIVCNAVGFAVAIIGVIVFMVFAETGRDRLDVAAKSAAIVIVAVGLVALFLSDAIFSDSSKGELAVGILASIATIIMFAAPLVGVAEIIRKRNARQLSPVILAASLVVCCIWVAFGGLLSDPFIIAPNAACAAITCFQIGLRILFGAPDTPTEIMYKGLAATDGAVTFLCPCDPAEAPAGLPFACVCPEPTTTAAAGREPVPDYGTVTIPVTGEGADVPAAAAGSPSADSSDGANAPPLRGFVVIGGGSVPNASIASILNRTTGGRTIPIQDVSNFSFASQRDIRGVLEELVTNGPPDNVAVTHAEVRELAAQDVPAPLRASFFLPVVVPSANYTAARSKKNSNGASGSQSRK